MDALNSIVVAMAELEAYVKFLLATCFQQIFLGPGGLKWLAG